MEINIKELFEKQEEKEVEIKGWVVSNRGNNKIRFLIINDGSTSQNIQVILKAFENNEIENAKIGTPVLINAILKKTPDSKQPIELLANKVLVLSKIEDDFPIQKQEINRETLREIPHLRHKTSLFKAIFRIRSTLLQEIHNYFYERNFLNVSSPIITCNDGEGAGEAFLVKTENKEDFFDKKATLSVTGQLHAEAMANGFKNVYTFGPTFRAENSHTKKHAAEFWMIEPEMEFASYDDAIKIADDLLKTIIKKTLKRNREEFDVLASVLDLDPRDYLNIFVEKGIKKTTYSNAIEELIKAKNRFDVSNINFGIDLGTEHEKYLAEEVFKGPVAIVDYPKEIKAFYMKQNADGKTVGSFDILVPGIGELVGGSERETNVKKLINRIEEVGLDKEEMKWYIDLRRFGHVKSSGFGIGFERLVMYVTGVDNIRDVIPFPRTKNSLKM